MNSITIEGTITRVTDFHNALGIQCHDNMFSGKTSRFATRVVGESARKWQGKLKDGYVIKIRGNVAEARSGSCGTYIVIYNPEILDVYRLVRERYEDSPKDNGLQEQEGST